MLNQIINYIKENRQQHIIKLLLVVLVIIIVSMFALKFKELAAVQKEQNALIATERYDIMCQPGWSKPKKFFRAGEYKFTKKGIVTESKVYNLGDCTADLYNKKQTKRR